MVGLCALPVVSMSNDSYDPSTGILHMPNVNIGLDSYQVDMLHQGNMAFKVTTALLSTSVAVEVEVDSYDPATGILHMPSVDVGAESYEVDMMHQGHLVFKLTAANLLVQGDSVAGLEFTTDWLNGKTLYNVYFEQDDNQWFIATQIFTESTYTMFDNHNPSLRVDDRPYSITNEGYITFFDSHENETKYIKAVNTSEDFIELIWTSDMQNLNSNTTEGEEFYYFDLQTAENFVNMKNAEIEQNHGCILPQTWHAEMGHCMIQN